MCLKSTSLNKVLLAFPLLMAVLGPTLASVKANESDPLDWPYWRGPEYNGISRETGLVDDWDPRKGTNVAWKRADLGGRSTPIVMRGKLYTIVRADPGTATEGEKVVCVDAASGETIWENRFNVYLSDVPDTRVGWSSCVGDPTTGLVYSLGVCGLFQCLDGETGKTIWSRPLHEEFGLLSTYGGRTNFPVIIDDLVIISAVIIGWGDMAKPAHRFIAFDKNTGDVVWFRGTRLLPYDTTYSAPTVTVLNGQAALVFGSGDGAVWAFQPRTGVPIWNFELSRRGLNIAPLVVGDTVFMSHSEENMIGNTMGTVVAIDGSGTGDITDSGQLWRIDELMAGKSSPIVVNNKLLVVDDRAKLHLFDARKGEPLGRRTALGTVMRSSPLYADGKVYTCTANGRWYILGLDERGGVKKLKSGRLPSGEESHGSPICSHGRVYLPTTGALYCLYDATKKHGVSDRPAPPAEEPVQRNSMPAHVQLVPAELLLYPGDERKFKVRLFNSRGQFLSESDASFSLAGPGSITDDGTFTAPTELEHTAAVVRAKVGDLQGTARIRIVPPLPWRFNFDDVAINSATNSGEPPITWVGARYRHVVRNMDGNNVMVKVTTIPKGTRSRCWFGHSHLKDYTIQADVRGALNNGKLPDIGLIAQGYALDLQGASQQLQIRTWVPQLRMATTVDYPWQQDKWYTMKLSASVEGENAMLRGKVWPKDEPEPIEWTVTATDAAPNLRGSPGLYGNAKDAEIYLDEIIVSANEF